MEKNANLPRVDQSRPSIFAANGLILLAAVGLWIGSFIVSLLPLGDSEQGTQWGMGLFYYLPFVVLPILIYARRNRGLSAAMRLNPLSPLSTAITVAMAIVSTFAASVLTTAWTLLLEALGLEFLDISATVNTSSDLMQSVITMAAIPAVCEELLFRGFALSAWETRGTRFAIIITSVIFSLMHSYLFGLPAYLFVAVTAGYLVYAFDSLYAGIVFHTVYNVCCLAVSFLSAPEVSADQSLALMEEVFSARVVILSLILYALILGLILVPLFCLVNNRRKAAGIAPVPRIREPIPARAWVVLALALIPMGLMMALSMWTGGGA